MAKLPVYNQQAQISTQAVGLQDMNAAGQAWRSVAKLGEDISQTALEWREVQDYSEYLNRKNAFEEESKKLLEDAETYGSYETPKDIENKAREFKQRAIELSTNVNAGFTDSIRNQRYKQQFDAQSNTLSAQLDGIMRKKYIDNSNAMLNKSYATNYESFVQTGDNAFKESMISDMNGARERGLMSQDDFVENEAKIKSWDIDRIKGVSATDPEYAKGLITEYGLSGKDKADVTNFVYAQQKRVAEQRFFDASMKYMKQPTKEGFDELVKLKPDMSDRTIEKYEEMMDEIPDYETITDFKDYDEAKKTLDSIAENVLSSPSGQSNAILLDNLSDFIIKTNKSNKKVVEINGKKEKIGLDEDDKNELSNLAYKVVNDNVFAEQVHKIFGSPNAFEYATNWVFGKDDFARIEQIGLQTTRDTVQALMNGDAEGAEKIYKEGQKKAIQIRYPEIPFDKLKEGDIFWYAPTEQAFKFVGYGLDDVLVEVDPNTGVAK